MTAKARATVRDRELVLWPELLAATDGVTARFTVGEKTHVVPCLVLTADAAASERLVRARTEDRLALSCSARCAVLHDLLGPVLAARGVDLARFDVTGPGLNSSTTEWAEMSVEWWRPWPIAHLRVSSTGSRLGLPEGLVFPRWAHVLYRCSATWLLRTRKRLAEELLRRPVADRESLVELDEIAGPDAVLALLRAWCP